MYLIVSIIFFMYIVLMLYYERMPLPSMIFSGMWGIACMLVHFVHCGYFEKVKFLMPYMDGYITPFAITCVSGFLLAHVINWNRQKVVVIDKFELLAIIKKYRFVLYLNCAIGIFKIIIVLQTIGIESLMDYRIAALSISNVGGAISFILRIGNYFNLLSHIYIIFLGFSHGFITWRKQEMIVGFILYSMMSIAAAGRLFILYFMLFYFVPFYVGRYFKKRNEGDVSLFQPGELKSMVISVVFVISLVGLVGQLRDTNNTTTTASKYLYFTDGMRAADNAMRLFDKQNDYGNGMNTFFGDAGKQTQKYRYLVQGTKFQFTVYSLIHPIYLDFGYWGSLIFLFSLCFIIEMCGIWCLCKLTFVRLLIFFLCMKICYESVIFPSVSINIPFVELILILAILHRYIFASWIESTMKIIKNTI